MNESFKQQNTVPDQNLDPEKVNRWEEKRKEIDQMGDRTGKGIDGGIKETIIALNIYDLPTRNSCEGHLDHGVPFPFADIEAPNKPTWKREGEKELFESVAQEKNIPLEKLNRESLGWDVDLYEDVLGEAGKRMNEMADEGKELPDTEEYQKWKEENKKLHTRTQELLKEFYAEQQPLNKDAQIFIDGEGENGFNVRPQGGFERFADALMWREHINEERAQGREMSPEELQELAGRLMERRAEMDRFAEFLKKKFISNAEPQQGGLKNFEPRTEK